MRSLNIIFVSVLLLTLFLGAVYGFAQVNGQSSGFVQYKVAFNSSENPALSVSATVNESAQPANQAGFIDLTLGISFDSTSLTYSKDVNSSSLPEVFPYLPAITNQSLSYAFHGYLIDAKLVNAGQVQVTFNGTVYSGTKYLFSFSATNSSSVNSLTGNGDIICLPSDLIDTAQISLNQTGTVTATLLSTDLPLNSVSVKVNSVGVSLFGVLLAAVVAIAALTIFRKVRENKRSNQAEEERRKEEGTENEGADEDKPSYWVD